ncbi:hypothetical protein TWF718_009906 [Orbilia javanica]|uniref:Uncharacterized protein n=1 Tax=Orbilia javanica TaxID=47235 RepID=A0AAN8RAV7_9PEZI
MKSNLTNIWVFVLVLVQVSAAVRYLDVHGPRRPRDTITTTITDVTTLYWTQTESCGSTATAGGGNGGSSGGGGGGGTNGGSSGGGGTSGGRTGTGGTGSSAATSTGGGSGNPTATSSGGVTSTRPSSTITGSGGTTGTRTSSPISITSSPTTTEATERFRLVATAEDGSLSYIAVNSANFAVVTDSPPPYYFKFDEFGTVRELSSDPKSLFGVITSGRKRSLLKRQSRVGYIGGAPVVPAGALGNFSIVLSDNIDFFEIELRVEGVLAQLGTYCTPSDAPSNALAILLGLIPSELNCTRLRLGGFRPNVNPSTIRSSQNTASGTGTGTGTGTNTNTGTGTGTGSNGGTSGTACATPIPENADLQCRGSDSSTGHTANGREFLLCQGEVRLLSSRLRTLDDVAYLFCPLECGNDLECVGFIYDRLQSKCFLLSDIAGGAVIHPNYYMGIMKCNDLTINPSSTTSSSTENGGSSSASESSSSASSSDSGSSSQSSSSSDTASSSSASPSASVTPVPKCYNFISDNNDWVCEQGATSAISSTVIATTSATVAYAAALCYNTQGVSLPASTSVKDCIDKCIALGSDGCKMFTVDSVGQCVTLGTVDNGLWNNAQNSADNLVGGMLCDDFGSPKVCWQPVTATSSYQCPSGYTVAQYNATGDQLLDVCLPAAYDASTSEATVAACVQKCFSEYACIGFSINPDQSQPCTTFAIDEEIDAALSTIKGFNLPNYVLALVRCKDRRAILGDCVDDLGSFAYERCETFASIVEEELGDGRSVRMCRYENRGITTVFSTITTSTALYCAQYCGLLESCDVFTWNKATGLCNAGTGLASASTAQVDMNVLTGWTVCELRTEHGCVTPNALAARTCDTGSTTGFGYAPDDRSFRICTADEYTGSTEMSQTNLLKTVTECAYYCTIQGDGCTYFTWNSATSVCYIYSAFGTRNANAPKGTVSGWTLCDDNKPGTCASGYESNRLNSRLCPDNTEILIQNAGTGSFGNYRVCRDSTLTGLQVPNSMTDTTVSLFRSCEQLCEQTYECLFWAMRLTDILDQRGVCNVYIRPGTTMVRDATSPGVLNIGYPLCVPIQGDTGQAPSCSDPTSYESLRCYGSYGDMISATVSFTSNGKLYRWCSGQSNSMESGGTTFSPIRTLGSMLYSTACADQCVTISGCISYIWDSVGATCQFYTTGQMGTPIPDYSIIQGWFICDTESSPLTCPNYRSTNVGFTCGVGQYFEYGYLVTGEVYMICGPGSGIQNPSLNLIKTIALLGSDGVAACAEFCNLVRAATSVSSRCSFWTVNSAKTQCSIYSEFGSNQWTDATGAYSGYSVCDTSYESSCPDPLVSSNRNQGCLNGNTDVYASTNSLRMGLQCSGQLHDIGNSGVSLYNYATKDACRLACFDSVLCAGYLWNGIDGDDGSRACWHVSVFSAPSNVETSSIWTTGYVKCSNPS